ncbi:hypothetical protein BDF21DRAFT_402388 [Thamnidium elegans]|nr:hypothetical protein BDF21DRAFT_402388 [Thamnidium elegans]
MSKRVFNNAESSGSSEASKNKRKKLDEEHTLSLQKYNFTRKCKVSTLLKEPFRIYKTHSYRLMANDTNNLNSRIRVTYKLENVYPCPDEVILVDEFRTSVTCSRCHGTLEKKYTRCTNIIERIVYCLKVFPTCLDGKKIWHRDVNAAINIKDIMMDYINSQYDIKSRHPSLCRGTPPAVILPTATSS